VATVTRGCEVWFRNPLNYIREVVEVGHGQVVFDRGLLVKKHIDPLAWADIFFPVGMHYRLLLVGDQGSAEYCRGDKKPRAVYPTWDYLNENLTDLEDLLANPFGEDEELCSSNRTPLDERPVLGQEHRVVIINLPDARQGIGKRILRELTDLQQEYPEAILHVHGSYSHRIFTYGFGAVDLELRTDAQKGYVILANGKRLRYEQAKLWPQWVKVVGMTPGDLAQPRNRCIFNMKSALWAGGHYNENVSFRVQRSSADVVDISSKRATPVTIKGYRRGGPARDGDKFLCDSCSFARTCKYYREGAVCSVPDSDAAELGRMFKTRDSDTIIDGLGTVLAKQVERLETGMTREALEGELDPEVTRVANLILQNGNRLAKLVNPALQGGTKVGVFVGAGGAQAALPASPKALVANMIAELEKRGIPREKITNEMILNLMEGGIVDQRAIEGTVVSERAG
jgi:hypothetical protein